MHSVHNKQTIKLTQHCQIVHQTTCLHAYEFLLGQFEIKNAI